MSHLHHKVSALVDGELTGAARARALSHVQRCADCRRELDATLALKQRLGSLRATDPSPDLFSSLGSVSASPAPTQCRARTGVRGRRLLLGAGSVSLALLSLSYALGPTDEPATAAVVPPIQEYGAEFAANTGLQPLSDPAVSALAGDTDYTGSSVQQVAASREQTGFAALVTSPVVSPGDDPLAVQDLSRAMRSPASASYRGTQVIDVEGPQGMQRTVVKVQHTPDQGTGFEVVGGSGTSQEYAAFVAERAAAEAGGLTRERLDLLLATYDVDVIGSERVLGRSATVVSASRRGVASATFWIDDQTGLVLSRELYDSDGAVVRSSRFTELQVSTGFMDHLPPEMAVPSSTTVSRELAASLNDQGWTCPATLADQFSLIVLHRLDDLDDDVMHAAYSDGLSTVSIFEQRGTLDGSALSGFETRTVAGEDDVRIRVGLPTVAVWESAGTVYTVVTDAPRDVATGVVAMLPHESVEDPGTAARIGAGFSRLVGAANPLN